MGRGRQEEDKQRGSKPEKGVERDTAWRDEVERSTRRGGCGSRMQLRHEEGEELKKEMKALNRGQPAGGAGRNGGHGACKTGAFRASRAAQSRGGKGMTFSPLVRRRRRRPRLQLREVCLSAAGRSARVRLMAGERGKGGECGRELEVKPQTAAWAVARAQG